MMQNLQRSARKSFWRTPQDAPQLTSGGACRLGAQSLEVAGELELETEICGAGSLSEEIRKSQ